MPSSHPTPERSPAPDELIGWIDLAEQRQPQTDWTQEALRLLGLAELLSADASRDALAPAGAAPNPA